MINLLSTKGRATMRCSSQDDLGTSHDEQVSFTNSPSSKDEDLDVDGSEGDSKDEDIGSAEPLI